MSLQVTVVIECVLIETVAASVTINRVKRVMPNMLATGDDDGVVKVRLYIFCGLRSAANTSEALGSEESRGYTGVYPPF